MCATYLITSVHEDGLGGRGYPGLGQRPALWPGAAALQFGMDVCARGVGGFGGEGLVVALHLSHLEGQLSSLAVGHIVQRVPTKLNIMAYI